MRNCFNPSPEVLSGDTAVIYFHRALRVLEKEGHNPRVTMEIFTRKEALLCGIEEVHAILKTCLTRDDELLMRREGQRFKPGLPIIRITAPYQRICLYETAILGILASETGWASAARDCCAVAGETPVVAFGARHIHPDISARMEYAACVGGCAGGSTMRGAALTNKEPSGTMPHSLILCIGDTLDAARAFSDHIDKEVNRVVLVDTFKDEVDESLRVAEGLGKQLWGVRLDTPSERGGVTPALVRELRAKLDLAGHNWLKIVVSGGLNPTRIMEMESGGCVDMYCVGSYISGATPIDFTADIKEVNGRPVAKRGRIPGITNPHSMRKVDLE